MKYKFQNLLQMKDGEIAGAFSPVHAAKILCKSMNIKMQSLIRLHNNQAESATYDHLIILNRYRNTNIMYLFVDMGIGVMGISLYDSEEDDITWTPLYPKEITKEARLKHLKDMEQSSYSNDNPIMVLGDDDIREIYKDLISDEDNYKVKGV
jgi:hypothetical protein